MGIDHLSYTSVTTWLACPQRWYRHYVAQHTSPLSPVLFLGGTLHLSLAYYFQSKLEGYTPAIAEILEHFCRNWRARTFLETSPMATGVRWGRGDEETRALALGKEMLMALLEHSGHLRPKGVEQEFSFTVEDMPITGRIDLITQEGWVIDWKTSQRSWTETQRPASLQPLFYAAGLGGPIDFRYHVVLKTYTADVEVHRFPVSLREIRWFLHDYLPPVVLSIRQALESGVFPYADPASRACNEYCDYWEVCPSGARRVSWAREARKKNSLERMSP